MPTDDEEVPDEFIKLLIAQQALKKAIGRYSQSFPETKTFLDDLNKRTSKINLQPVEESSRENSIVKNLIEEEDLFAIEDAIEDFVQEEVVNYETNAKPVKMDSEENFLAKNIIENFPKDFIQEEDDPQKLHNDISSLCRTLQGQSVRRKVKNVMNEGGSKTSLLQVEIDSEENFLAKNMIENIPKEKHFVKEEDDHQKLRNDISSLCMPLQGRRLSVRRQVKNDMNEGASKTNLLPMEMNAKENSKAKDIIKDILKEKDLVQEEDDILKFLNGTFDNANAEQVKMDSEENFIAKDIIENIPKEKDFVQDQTFLNDTSNVKSNETNVESVKIDSEENSTSKNIFENIPKEKDFVQVENDHQKHLNDNNDETNQTTANPEKMDSEENFLAGMPPKEKDVIEEKDDHKVVYQLLDKIMEILKTNGLDENLENLIGKEMQQIKDELSKLSKKSTSSVPTMALVSVPPPPPPGPPPPPPPTRDPLSSLKRGKEQKMMQGGININGLNHVEIRVQKCPEDDMMNQLKKMLNRRKNRDSLAMKYSSINK